MDCRRQVKKAKEVNNENDYSGNTGGHRYMLDFDSDGKSSADADSGPLGGTAQREPVFSAFLRGAQNHSSQLWFSPYRVK
jgi:hypothetical protein